MRGGPGSLISLLGERRLCNYVMAKYGVKAGIGFFTTKCEVPRNFQIREDDVVELVMQVIGNAFIFLA